MSRAMGGGGDPFRLLSRPFHPAKRLRRPFAGSASTADLGCVIRNVTKLVRLRLAGALLAAGSVATVAQTALAHCSVRRKMSNWPTPIVQRSALDIPRLEAACPLPAKTRHLHLYQRRAASGMQSGLRLRAVRKTR